MSTFRIPANRRKMDPSLMVAGLSALSCQTCGVHLSGMEEDTILTYYSVSASCGHEVIASEARLAVRPDYEKFLNVRGLLEEPKWYHATMMSDWENRILDPVHEILVHIGSEESALDRARYAGGKYMNVIKLKDDAHISPYVVDDQNLWPDEMRETRLPEWGNFSEVTRYVNRYEVPGSVSLLVAASALDVVETYTLR